MSSAEHGNIPNKLKKEVKDMLGPYFTRDYKDDVKNPVLLLNFLYQHAVISKPVYDIRADLNKPFHFIGSCSLGPLKPKDSAISCAVGPLKVEVEASSKKRCKNSAAQKILNLFLKDEEMDVVVDCDNREYHIDLGIKNFSIKHIENFYEDDLSGILSFDDNTLSTPTTWSENGRRESRKQINAGYIIAEPQGPVPCVVNGSLVREEVGKSGTSKCKTLKEKQRRSTRLKRENIKIEDSHRVISNGATRAKSSDKCSTKKNNIAKVEEQDTLIMKSARLLSSDTQNRSRTILSSESSSQSSSHSFEDQRVVSNEIAVFSDNLCVDFFDPFSRLRPKLTGQMNSNRKENTSDVGKENTNDETAISHVTHEKFSTEIGQNNKTPFQILQEKAIKNFKLIPRSRIDMTDGGFSCTLILDTHTGSGEGRTKKEAKLNAATHLLQLLENRQ